MTRGEIYRTNELSPERGDKPGFYIIVSRAFVAENEQLSTVVCAPAYSRILGLSTEVEVGEDAGLPHASAIRCDFLCLMFKAKLTRSVGALPAGKLPELDRALAVALDLPTPMERRPPGTRRLAARR